MLFVPELSAVFDFFRSKARIMFDPNQPIPSTQVIEHFQEVYHAIADPTRRSLLESLLDGEKDVNTLARPFDMSLPAISQHLRILRTAGLIQSRKDGNRRIYFLTPEPLIQVQYWLAMLQRPLVFDRGKTIHLHKKK